MATTILALITDHINFLEQSKQAQAADEVKEAGRSYPDSNLCGQKETGEIYHFKDTAQVRMQLVVVILLFADLDASAQLQQLVGSLLQVSFSDAQHSQTDKQTKETTMHLPEGKRQKLVHTDP